MASSNRCSVCPKGAGTCFCPGCKAYFCDKDFKQHREMLFNSLDELTVDRNDLQEKINKASSKKQFGSSLLSRIDEWQEITIGKVKQAAEQARQQALKIMNSKREEITRQFQTLSQELEQLRETEGVLEQDLARLKQQIGQLNKGLEQLSQPSVGELNVKQSDQIVWNRMIYVEEKSAHADYQQHRPQLREEQSPVPKPVPKPVPRNFKCGGQACRNCGKCSDWYLDDRWTWKRHDGFNCGMDPPDLRAARRAVARDWVNHNASADLRRCCYYLYVVYVRVRHFTINIIDITIFFYNHGMDQSCSTNYAYITCCLIIALNIVYFIFTLIKLYIQHQRRRLPRFNQKMTDKQNEITSRITTSTIKTGSERLSQLYPHVNEDTLLPSKWNSKEKAATLVLQQNNLVVTYKGPGKSHKDAASVRSDHPIPPLTGIYYYEVKILSKGRDGYMGIGLSTGEVNLNRLPGWDKGSYGYHGDDGHSFCSSGSGIAYGPTFTTGDYVGCCVNFLENSCFYTRNGYNIGTSFKDIPTEIYPTVGLQTPLEAIEANFGLSPFKFDIEKYMDEYREKTRRNIVECTLKEGELLHQTQLRRIVSTYLVHYGYCATAEQFNKNAESVYADELNSMRNRQLIQHLILEGHTTDAIEKTKELFPTLLNNKNLLFVLKVRQFIEMINGTESEISSPSTSSHTTNSLSLKHKHRSNSPSYKKHSSRSSSPITKPNTSSRSRSNSPYTSGTNSGAQQHTNSTTNSSSRRSSANNTELPQETNTTVNLLPTNNTVANLMDIDDDLYGNSTTNGFSNHGTVSHSSSSTTTNQISNGHSLLDDDSNNEIHDKNTNSNGCLIKTTENINKMEYDGISDTNHKMDIEAISSDDQLLVRILQFGKELHALKQQLNLEYGENVHHDKILQDAFSLLAYPDPKLSPLANLLEPSQRETVSSVLNSAILEAHDMPRHPALEVLVGYLNECDKLMHKNNIPDCAFIELNKYLR